MTSLKFTYLKNLYVWYIVLNAIPITAMCFIAYHNHLITSLHQIPNIINYYSSTLIYMCLIIVRSCPSIINKDFMICEYTIYGYTNIVNFLTLQVHTSAVICNNIDSVLSYCRDPLL